MQPLHLRSFPRAIIHIDADAFFAACEQAVNPHMKGRPVITGKERGIASAVSYEARALGIKRGMSIRDIKAICPDIIYLPSDYETYSLFSKRIFAIVRKYTGELEEYSIDECFAELTGLRRPLHMSYPHIATRIKYDLERDLGLTFSLGLGPSKVVAKIASKWKKPAGLTVISGRELHLYLAQVSIADVWGIGEQTQAYLKRYHINTALDFALKGEDWVRSHLSKPYIQIWQELRGEAVIPLETNQKHDYQSISKTKTFTPPSSDRDFLFSQLSRNIENACIKARRYQLEARRVFFILRSQDYRHTGYEIRLSRPSNIPSDIIRVVGQHFDLVYRPQTLYRLTGVVLSGLLGQSNVQLDLFGEALLTERGRKVYEAVDMLDSKYGKHTVFLGSSFHAIDRGAHKGSRAELSRRRTMLLKGEGPRRKLGIPLLGDVK